MVVNLSKSRIIAGNAKVKAQILVERYVNATAIFRRKAGGLALATIAALSRRVLPALILDR